MQIDSSGWVVMHAIQVPPATSYAPGKWLFGIRPTNSKNKQILKYRVKSQGKIFNYLGLNKLRIIDWGRI